MKWMIAVYCYFDSIYLTITIHAYVTLCVFGYYCVICFRKHSEDAIMSHVHVVDVLLWFVRVCAMHFQPTKKNEFLVTREISRCTW